MFHCCLVCSPSGLHVVNEVGVGEQSVCACPMFQFPLLCTGPVAQFDGAYDEVVVVLDTDWFVLVGPVTRNPVKILLTVPWCKMK